MAKTIQEVLENLNKNLTEAIRCYDEGLVCPRESLNYLLDQVCTAQQASDQVSCSQDWKPCLTEEHFSCTCKERAQGSDIVGVCDVCRKEVASNESFTVTGGFPEGVRHKSCCH